MLTFKYFILLPLNDNYEKDKIQTLKLSKRVLTLNAFTTNQTINKSLKIAGRLVYCDFENFT